MTKHLCLAVIVSAVFASSAAAQNAPYYPDRFDWQKHTPQQEGFDAARLDEAIRFAIASDNPAPRDQAVVHQQSFAANEPFDGAACIGRCRLCRDNADVVRIGVLRALAHIASPQKVDAAIVSDAKQPGLQPAGIVEGLNLRVGLEQRLLHEILTVEA